MKTQARTAILICAAVLLSGCVRTAPTAPFELGPGEAVRGNEAIVFGKIEFLKSSGKPVNWGANPTTVHLGIGGYAKYATIRMVERRSGKEFNSVLRGDGSIYWHLPPGVYEIRGYERQAGQTSLQALKPAGKRPRFTVTSRDKVVYVGTLVLGKIDEVVYSDYGSALQRFRSRYPSLQGQPVRRLWSGKRVTKEVARAPLPPVRIPQKRVEIDLSPRSQRTIAVPRPGPSAKVRVMPVSDRRKERDRIGERTAAMGVPMGEVYPRRPVVEYFREALREELRGMGHRVVERGEDWRATPRLTRFWVTTETTPLYWDVLASVDCQIDWKQTRGGRSATRRYEGRAKRRTYVWPTARVMESALGKALDGLFGQMRSDSSWQ